jgi:DASS family divalent anion:Na+ symporter
MQTWGGFAAALTIGLVVAALPTPDGLSRQGQLVLAVSGVTVALWVFRSISNGIASILMMGLMVPIGVRPALALSGFSSPSLWILVAVLFYGFAMQQTGLAQRVAFHILKLFPPTYTGILFAFFTIGFVLALGVPSSTVRSAIMLPIAWAMVQSLGLGAQSRGSALIMLTTIEMAVSPGASMRYGSLFGPVVDSVFVAKNLPLTWAHWAQVMWVPMMAFCTMTVFVNQWVIRAEPLPTASAGFARERLAALGPMKRTEIVVAILVLISFAFWATDRYHHLPSFMIGLLVVPVFALFGIVREENISTAIPWGLLLFLGGAFSLANIIQEYKITDWVAGFLIPLAQQLSFSPLLMLLAVAVAMFAMRFLDPSGFIAIPVLFLPIVDVAGRVGIPPMVLTAALLMGAAPFWLTYQNVWVAMGEGITKGNAYSNGQRLRLANTYGVLVLAGLTLATVYWRLIGVL